MENNLTKKEKLWVKNQQEILNKVKNCEKLYSNYHLLLYNSFPNTSMPRDQFVKSACKELVDKDKVSLSNLIKKFEEDQKDDWL